MQMGSRPQGSSNYPELQQRLQPPGAGAVASQKTPVAEEIPTINLDEEQDEVKIEDVPF